MTAIDRRPAEDHPADDDQPLGKRERNKLDKRRRIVEAATKLFQKDGFEATTTAAIASEAGIGAGTLYLYVDSKDDLLVDVFESVAGDAWNEAFDCIDRDAPLVEQLHELFLFVANHHVADLRLARSFFNEPQFTGGPIRGGVDRMMRRFYSQLDGLLHEAVADGRLDDGVPTKALARVLFTLWSTNMRRHCNGRLTFADMVARLDEEVQLVLWKMTPETQGTRR